MRVNINIDATKLGQTRKTINSIGDSTIKFAKEATNRIPASVKGHKKEVVGASVLAASVLSAVSIIKMITGKVKEAKAQKNS